MNHSTSVWFSGRRGLIFVLLLYAVATLPALTRYPAPWVDEGWIGEVAAQISRGHAAGNPSHGTLYHFNDRIYWMPPLYFFLLGGWFKLLGVTLLAGRLLNVLVGAATVALLHRVVSRRYGASAALVACLVLLLDTFAWKAHRTIRFESAMTFLAVLLFDIVTRLPAPGGGERKSAPLPWIAAGLAAGLLLNTHPLGALFVAAALVEILRSGGLRVLRTSGPWLAAVATILAVLPYGLYCLADRASGFANLIGQNSYHVDLGPESGPVWTNEWRRYASFFPAPWRLPAAAILLAIVAASWPKRRDRTVGAALVFLAVPLLGMAFLPNKTLLYLVPVLPFTAILAGAAWPSRNRFLRGAAIVLIALNLAVDAGLLFRSRDCDPVASLQAIRSHLLPDDRVAGTFVTWWAAQPRPFHEFSRGATLEAVDAFDPDVIVLGDRQWEQEKAGRFGPLDRALHERFAARGIVPGTIADPCLGTVTLYRVRERSGGPN